MNSAGEGAALERALRHDRPPRPAAPTLDSATAGNGSVALAWSPPASNGGAAITGYTIYRGTTSGGGDAADDRRQRDRVHGHGRHERHDLLLQGRRDQRGRQGARSNERSATPRHVPGAPTLVSATPATACRAGVERTRVERRGGDHGLCGLRAAPQRQRDAAGLGRQRHRLHGRGSRERDELLLHGARGQRGRGEARRRASCRPGRGRCRARRRSSRRCRTTRVSRSVWSAPGVERRGGDHGLRDLRAAPRAATRRRCRRSAT